MCPGHFADRNGEQHCSYCGSITIEKLVELLATPGTSYGGSDWKYGWPHKFYIDSPAGHFKFYASHLLGKQDCDLWNGVAASLLGIRYIRDEKGLRYIAVCDGWQTWGVVGGPTLRPDLLGAGEGPGVPEWFMKLPNEKPTE